MAKVQQYANYRCGIADETNLHMLCECTGNTELVKERRSWISKMRKVVKGTLSKHMNPAQLDVPMSLWNVDELGKINLTMGLR